MSAAGEPVHARVGSVEDFFEYGRSRLGEPEVAAQNAHIAFEGLRIIDIEEKRAGVAFGMAQGEAVDDKGPVCVIKYLAVAQNHEARGALRIEKTERLGKGAIGGY